MKLAILMSSSAEFPEKQVRAACSLARALDLPLTGVATSEASLDYYTVGSTYYADTIARSVSNVEERLQTFSVNFREICAAEAVRQEWFGVYGFMRYYWPEMSPYFDLAVVPPPLSAPEIATSGVSVTLQVCDDTEFGDFNGRALIAWDGSREAAMAVRSALPILPRFATVDVIIVDPKTRTMPHDIGTYLAAHGVSAQIMREPLAGSSVADLILEQAETADLLVMGAYGGSMALEKIFGGVTERIHRDCETPILFAN